MIFDGKKNPRISQQVFLFVLLLFLRTLPGIKLYEEKREIENRRTQTPPVVTVTQDADRHTDKKSLQLQLT